MHYRRSSMRVTLTLAALLAFVQTAAAQLFPEPVRRPFDRASTPSRCQSRYFRLKVFRKWAKFRSSMACWFRGTTFVPTSKGGRKEIRICVSRSKMPRLVIDL